MSIEPHVGAVALTPDGSKVALVRGGADATVDEGRDGGWRFPVTRLEGKPTEAQQLEAALAAARHQLGLDARAQLCAEPVLQAAGPGSQGSTKFFLAIGVPERPLAPQQDGAAGEAAWLDWATLLAAGEGKDAKGDQTLAVLRQLQVLVNSGVHYLLPSSGGELAGLVSWQGDGGWKGTPPKEALEAYCRQHKLPSAIFNVFRDSKIEPRAREDRAAHARFCVTCLLPHLGLQVTPDAAYPSAEEALQNGALVGILYLEGAIAPGCPLVHVAAAGEMAHVPHGYLTEAEFSREERARQALRERGKQRRALEAEVARKQRELEREMRELRRQQELLQAGDFGAASALQQAAAAAAAAPKERPAKRAKTEKPPPTLMDALAATPPDNSKNPITVLKEVCDKCRWALPEYAAGSQQRGACTMRISLPQAGIVGMEGPPGPDPKQAKALAAAQALEAMRASVAAGAGGGEGAGSD